VTRTPNLLPWLATIVATTAAAAPCVSGLPLARVDSVEAAAGEPVPQRLAPDGTRSPLKAYDWLCGGDRLEIRGQARVVVVFPNGVASTFTKDSNPAIGAAPADTGGRGPLDLLGEVFDRLRGPRQQIALFSQARDPGQTQPPLQADRLLPAGPQRLPPGYRRVALMWSGGPAIVTVATALPRQVSSGRRAYAVVEWSADEAPSALALLDQTLAWPLRFDGPVPAGSADARLAEALRLLRDGPADRRLFALSEVAGLAAQGHFAAEELWAAARSGELQEALGLR
jgi:hypothetical protein